jgi:putative tryptophan/tyrosine transport system substrate-binding protein
MRRRNFLSALGGAAAWPIAALAQQPGMPVVGFLLIASASSTKDETDGFRRGLQEAGYVEGQNVIIEYRWAEAHYDRLPTLVADLVHRGVAVIAAGGSAAPGLAAKAATSTIPVVFQTGSDPVKDGLVATMNRPGGNVTGVSRMAVTLEAKRLELLHELVPNATAVAFLVNPKSPRAELQLEQMHEAARKLGLGVQLAKASTEQELDVAFAGMVQQQVGGLLVAQEPSYAGWRLQITALAARHGIPATYGQREYAAAGGLMSYDASVADSFRQMGAYVGRILKGAKPADLPVLQPTKFELVINLRAVKALSLNVPPMLLARADEVIE